jgi:hypothetical protein
MIATRCDSQDRGSLRGTLSTVAACLLALLAALISLPGEALALKAIVVGPDQGRLEITTLGELYEGRGDSLQVETAAGEDGVVGRMSVSAATQGTNPNWIVFALTNPTDKPVERAPHRGGDAVDRLCSGAHQERPRRRIPHYARARADDHVRR